MNNIESNNCSQFINFQNNYPIYSVFPFNIDNEISSNQEQAGIAFDSKYIFNHTFTEDISIINRNIDPKHDIYEKQNFLEKHFGNSLITKNKINETFPFVDICSPKYNINNKEKNDKPFKIVKINKKIGRIKKNSMIMGKHNRLSEDNIIRKIKARFHEKLRLYINNEYDKFVKKNNPNTKNKMNWLKKINPKISRKIKKEENLKWFNSKINEILSTNISTRYFSRSPDSNKKKIDRIISLNKANKIIEILNSSIEFIFEKYINNEKIEGFKTLDDDINELRIQMKKSGQENIEEYLDKYKYIAKNMKRIFILKNSRNITSKK